MRSNSGGALGFRVTGATGALCRMLSKTTALVVPGKGACQWLLVEDATEGEEVAARIEFLATGLLRRHVGDSADGGARAGE